MRRWPAHVHTHQRILVEQSCVCVAPPSRAFTAAPPPSGPKRGGGGGADRTTRASGRSKQREWLRTCWSTGGGEKRTRENRGPGPPPAAAAASGRRRVLGQEEHTPRRAAEPLLLLRALLHGPEFPGCPYAHTPHNKVGAAHSRRGRGCRHFPRSIRFDSVAIDRGSHYFWVVVVLKNVLWVQLYFTWWCRCRSIITLTPQKPGHRDTVMTKQIARPPPQISMILSR
jgi:hypothetical protein